MKGRYYFYRGTNSYNTQKTKDRQKTYNIILRRVEAIIVAVENK